jgi:hypothetical protein
VGKRSSFKRVARDKYDTPLKAVQALLPHLSFPIDFLEPAAGARALVRHLENSHHRCVGASDIEPRNDLVREQDFLTFTPDDPLAVKADMVITNPPWGRKLLHQFILKSRELRLPAWLLIDANWMFTDQAAPFLPYCEQIVTIGRVIWIPGTRMTGKDDCAWFLFMPHRVEETVFIGKPEKLQAPASGD